MNRKDGFYTGTQQDIQSYLDAINGNELLPIEKPNGYRMEAWQTEPTECEEEGLYAAVKPHPDFLAFHGVDQATIDGVRAAFVDGKLTHVPIITRKQVEEV